MKPYKQNLKNGYILREFDANIDVSELVWHRDKKDRVVEVVSGNGWKFQLDNNLPLELKEGMVLQIPKETFHRIGKGDTKLVIKIKE
jgi:quercetin dioxygenase-like cupin family protein